MTALGAVEELIELVRSNDDLAHFGDGCPDELLDEAERELQLSLPPSYRRFLAEFGTCDVAGLEFLGIFRTPAMGDALLGTVRETLHARASWGLAESMIVVMFDEMGGLNVLDSSNVDAEDEAPVLAWTPDGSAEGLGADFGEYALARCVAAIRGWRSS